MNWWNELSTLQQIFATIAIPATLVLLIQIVLLIAGFSDGHSGDGDASNSDLNGHDFHGQDLHGHDLHAQDLHGHDLQSDDSHDHQSGNDHNDYDAIKLFTIRSIVAFLSVGGWTGVVMGGLDLPAPAAIVISFVAGWAALYFVTWSIRMAVRMQSSGNVIMSNAVGKTGEVYITIPAGNKGYGKVNVIVQERLSEFDASTNASRDLKTGETVLVTDILHEDVLVVMPQDEISLN